MLPVIKPLDQKIRILEVHHNADLYTFVRVPQIIYHDDPYWPGQNDLEEMAYLNAQSNLILKDVIIQPFIALKGNDVVGRICASIWEPFNQRWKQNAAFFGFFECVDDQEVADQLFQAVRNWVRDRGKTELWGPFSPNFMGVVGVLIDGFDKVPFSGMAYNPRYYQRLLENYGFIKEKDLLQMNFQVSEFYQKAKELENQILHLKMDPAYKIRQINREKIKEELALLAPVYAEGFNNHWASGEIACEYFVKVTEKYCQAYLIKDLFIIVEHEDRPIGFCLCQLDKNQISHAKTHKKPCTFSKVEGYMISVYPEYQSKRVATWIMYELAHRLEKGTFKEFAATWIVEDNLPSIKSCLKFGGKIASTFRVYRKSLL